MSCILECETGCVIQRNRLEKAGGMKRGVEYIRTIPSIVCVCILCKQSMPMLHRAQMGPVELETWPGH